MTKKIEVVTERWCCEVMTDLVPGPGSIAVGVYGSRKLVSPMYCKHCGQEHHYYRFMDAAGSMDWSYKRVEPETSHGRTP